MHQRLRAAIQLCVAETHVSVTVFHVLQGKCHESSKTLLLLIRLNISF